MTATSAPGNRYLTEGARSAELHARAQAVLPGGNTRTTVFTAPYPAYVASGQGARITDVEGETRLDCVNNYTALIHGHAHPRIVAAVGQQVARGSAFSFPTEHEIALAECLVQRVPSIERVRFTNSGSEAVMMAVQAARAFTGRPKAARFEGCYHGSYDFAEIDVQLPFNDAAIVERVVRQHAHELAAVLVDPLPHRPGFLDPRGDFLARLRKVTRETGVLLISDEIISFRLGYQGAQPLYGYTADLTTLGKIIGGGFPVGAFGGRADVMAVFDPSSGPPRLSHGGTYNANPVTMVAGGVAMEMLTPDAFDRLNGLGERVREGLADVIETRGLSWQVSGQGSLFKLHAHPRPLVDYASSRPTADEIPRVESMYMEMLAGGVVMTPDLAGALSTAMTDADVETIVEAAARAFEAQPA